MVKFDECYLVSAHDKGDWLVDYLLGDYTKALISE